MNMISQIRQRVKANGTAEITPEEFDQLQTEWIMRAGAEDLVLAEREACLSGVRGVMVTDHAMRTWKRCIEAIEKRSNAIGKPTTEAAKPL